MLFGFSKYSVNKVSAANWARVGEIIELFFETAYNLENNIYLQPDLFRDFKRWHEIENVHELMKDKSLLFHKKYDILYCLDDKFKIGGASCNFICIKL